MTVLTASVASKSRTWRLLLPGLAACLLLWGCDQPPNRDIAAAIEDGDLANVRQPLVRGADPNAVAAKNPDAAPKTDVNPTDLVAKFYWALLQKEEPTLEQERSLFGDNNDDISELPIWEQGKDNEPVMLRFCRKHKDWFLPKGGCKILSVN